jgi:tRNA(Arg) A34 adenosine deaminase TadA
VVAGRPPAGNSPSRKPLSGLIQAHLQTARHARTLHTPVAVSSLNQTPLRHRYRGVRPSPESILRGCRRQFILRVACCALCAVTHVWSRIRLFALSCCDKASPRPLFALQSSSILLSDLVSTATSAGLSNGNFACWHVIHSHPHSARIYAGVLAVPLPQDHSV